MGSGSPWFLGHPLCVYVSLLSSFHLLTDLALDNPLEGTCVATFWVAHHGYKKFIFFMVVQCHWCTKIQNCTLCQTMLLLSCRPRQSVISVHANESDLGRAWARAVRYYTRSLLSLTCRHRRRSGIGAKKNMFGFRGNAHPFKEEPFYSCFIQFT